MNIAMHSFHIPVMGTCYTADTPARVAPFGISSVVSLVDDILLERFRQYYAREFKLPFEPIARKEEDGRAKRITAYLDTLAEVVRIRFEHIQAQPFFQKNDKAKYFEMLPSKHPLRQLYEKLQGMKNASATDRATLEEQLTQGMRPGSIDVNIMVKLDRMPPAIHGNTLSEEHSDAKAALRGYAKSSLSDSSIVFSAGINQGLYNYMAQFRDFYRDAAGELRKKIIVKVSDFRSALIQGKFLARKGLEVSEFRIESGLNCGGHAFASQGQLLPIILKELSEKRDQLDQFKPAVEKYYKAMGWDASAVVQAPPPRVTVQGGIGNHGEDQRLTEYYGAHGTGWGSPFLLVPEATPVDAYTRAQLAEATPADLYLSDASPLGVLFNNLRNSGSEQWHKQRIAEGHPGSACPKGFLQNNTEFTDHIICTASRLYQRRKLEEIAGLDASEERKTVLRDRLYQKACICDHLGNSGLIFLGLEEPNAVPQSICPGPNVAWFTRNYSLQEMVDQIYGRIDDLTPAERPHMFAKEVEMYGDWFEMQVDRWEGDMDYVAWLREAAKNLFESMDYCLEVAAMPAFKGENLPSIVSGVAVERLRLQNQLELLNTKVANFSTAAVIG
jgi:hypothetical protein